jgi:hypothetical protein
MVGPTNNAAFDDKTLELPTMNELFKQEELAAAGKN